MFLECDGVILGSNQSYEGPAINLWKRWFDGRPVVSLGPLMPIDGTLSDRESASSHEVSTFLDDALKKFGSQSIVYVSLDVD